MLGVVYLSEYIARRIKLYIAERMKESHYLWLTIGFEVATEPKLFLGERIFSVPQIRLPYDSKPRQSQRNCMLNSTQL